jgi:hypothetical protein
MDTKATQPRLRNNNQNLDGKSEIDIKSEGA